MNNELREKIRNVYLSANLSDVINDLDDLYKTYLIDKYPNLEEIIIQHFNSIVDESYIIYEVEEYDIDEIVIETTKIINIRINKIFVYCIEATPGFIIQTTELSKLNNYYCPYHKALIIINPYKLS